MSTRTSIFKDDFSIFYTSSKLFSSYKENASVRHADAQQFSTSRLCCSFELVKQFLISWYQWLIISSKFKFFWSSIFTSILDRGQPVVSLKKADK